MLLPHPLDRGNSHPLNERIKPILKLVTLLELELLSLVSSCEGKTDLALSVSTPSKIPSAESLSLALAQYFSTYCNRSVGLMWM